MKISLLAFALLFLLACQPEPKQEEVVTPPPPAPTVDISPAAEVAPELPSMPEEEFKMLIGQIDYADIIYTDLGYSANVTDNGAKQIFSFILNQSSPRTACPNYAIIMFRQGTTDLVRADVHMGDNCGYFVFYKNNIATYCNTLSEGGRQRFASMTQGVRVE